MIRLGWYAVYKGSDYHVSQREDGRYRLFLRAGEEGVAKAVANGFTPDPENFGVYEKVVDRDQITTAYTVTTYAMYKGYKFQAIEKKDGKVEISSGDYGLFHDKYKELGLEMVDRGVYEKRVGRSELEKIWEVKRPVMGFSEVEEKE
ncbi:MAG: hypothetical protein H6Q67_2399 [Firmicutes bacterium]|nr:hypothetical protein [Bacillota bacterium]